MPVELLINPYLGKLITHFSTEVTAKRIPESLYRQTFWGWLEEEWHAVRVLERDSLTENDLVRFPDEETALHFKLRWG